MRSIAVRHWVVFLCGLVSLARLMPAADVVVIATPPPVPPATPVTPMNPTISVVPSGDTPPPDTNPPSVYGINGGGAVELGQNVVLTVILYSGTTATSYQWKKNGSVINGATNSSYAIAAAVAGDAGTYTVTVSNSIGSSVGATDVTVKTLAAPVITTQPRAQVLQAGQPATFSFVATGSYPRTYQWRRDGTNIAGATLATYTILAVTTNDAATYSVLISNSQGSASSNSASLTVNAATMLVLHAGYPYDASVTQGGSVSFYVSISSGSSPYTYQWRKNGNIIAGATAATLNIDPVAVADAGKYSVQVTNPVSTATSREATLSVTPATPVTFQSQPQSGSAYEGDSFSFSVSASSNSPMKFQWYHDGALITGASYSSYSVNPVGAKDAGSYTVSVSNVLGSVTSNPATLTVKQAVPPTINNGPVDVAVEDGESVYLSVSAIGSGSLKYQWYKDGVAVTSGSYSSLSFTANLESAGLYYVIVSNLAGSTPSRSAVVAVTPRPPPPVSTVTSRTATFGASVAMDTYYWGGSGQSYQWYHDGKLIPGATASSYPIASATRSDAGDYFVVVTNSGGSTTSRTGRLTISVGSTPGAGAWVAAVRQGDIVHFAFANPARIERYNILTESWLPPVALNRAPVAFTVSNNAYFIASGSIVYRYNLDGSGESILNSAFDSAVTGLEMFGEFVLAATNAYANASLSVLKPDGTRISKMTSWYDWNGTMVAAPAVSRVFSLTNGSSPEDITMAIVQSNGTISSGPVDSPYHGAYPIGSRLFVTPSQAHVMDDTGTVYQTSDLRYAGTLGGSFYDVSFTAAGEPVVLRSSGLFLYNPQFGEKGQISAIHSGARLFVQGQNAFVFGYPPSGGSISLLKVSLANPGTPPVAAALDGSQTAFTPDQTMLDRDGNLLLYSKVHGQIFRWSSATRAYLPSLCLQGWPDYVAYSSVNHRVYAAYADSHLSQIKLDAGATTETRFASSPQQPMSLVTAGDMVVVVDPTGAWVSHFVYGPDGGLRAQREWSYYSQNYTWDPVYRRLYQFRDDTSPNDLLYTEITAAGTFGTQKDSPYHGEITTRYPIRVSPDGGSILLGSGKFLDAAGMQVNNSLANTIDDAVWVAGKLITARATASGVELQRWGGSNYALDATHPLPGRLLRIFGLSGNRVLAVTARSKVTYFTILDASLTELSTDSGVLPARLVNIATRAMAGRDDQSLIPGFVIAGSEQKRVLIRAAGPALVPLGVTNVLNDPKFTVYNAAGVQVHQNDDWGSAPNLTELSAAANKLGAFPFSTGSRDAAALLQLTPGAYTIQTSGGTATAGVALVEVYDADDAPNGSRLVNIAARAQVGTGGEILIPGIVVQGNVSKTLLIRAVGPGLTAFGVGGVLADPKLKLYKGSQFVTENDNWGQPTGMTAAQVAAAAAKSGAFELTTGSKDATLLITLEPGSYTAQVSGASGGTGVALVEVYEVPN